MEKNRHNDNLFKKILEDHPDFPPPKEDIEDMRRRLDEANQPQRKKGFFFWWIPLLLLPFVLGSSYIFYQNQNLKSELQSIHHQLLTSKKDTTEQRHITYHFDTIYNVIYKDKIIERTFYPDGVSNSHIANTSVLNYLKDDFRTSPFYVGDKKNSTNDSFSNEYDANNSNDLFSKFQNHLIKSNSASTIFNNKALVSKEKEFWKYDNVNPIASHFSFLEKDVNRLADILLEESDIKFKKKGKRPLQYLTPKGFQLGLSGSPLGWTNLSNASSPLFAGGLTSEIEYSNNFRMTVGVQATRTKFEVKGQAEIATYPQIMPDDPTDMIRELYVTINNLQVPISLKYLFYKNKKWTPFVSAGFVASRPIQQSFGYEFISTSLQEYSRSQSFNEGVFSIKNLRGSFGMEYDFSPKWSANAELFYLHDLELNIGEYFLQRNVGVNLGIKRRL